MPRRVVPILPSPSASSFALSRATCAGVMMWARELITRRSGVMSTPIRRSASISRKRFTGLITMPLPMIETTLLCRMPEGTRCSL